MAEIKELSIDDCVPNPWNPQEMDDDTFNALAESIEDAGMIDPIQVVTQEGGKYRIIGGEHRWKACSVLGYETIPAVILQEDEFDEDRQKFLTVRMNILSGKMNPSKFYDMYSGLNEKYTEETMQMMFGFAKEEEFKKLIDQTIKALPDEMQEKVKEAKKEIRTIDDLTNLLNNLFTEYGDSLPSNVMAFSYGGKEVMWILAEKELWKTVKQIKNDSILGGKDMAEEVLTLLKSGLEIQDSTTTDIVKEEE